LSYRKVRAAVLSFVGWLLISLWSRTLRTRKVNREIPDSLKSEGKNFVYAFWHGRQFLMFYSHRDSGVVIPSSESRDGEIQAGILERFGFGVVRGSSKRKGERALLGLVEGLRKGKDVGVAVDGPRGPIGEVKDGAVYLAGKLARPIIPVSSSVARFWTLEKAWDKYMLPKPFTRGVIVYGKPVFVRGIRAEDIESGRAELKEALDEVTRQADEYIRGQAVKGS
jgi:lysophospholipid acyltransferase (LPLAT)-like uncharacterized protein